MFHLWHLTLIFLCGADGKQKTVAFIEGIKKETGFGDPHYAYKLRTHLPWCWG